MKDIKYVLQVEERLFDLGWQEITRSNRRLLTRYSLQKDKGEFYIELWLEGYILTDSLVFTFDITVEPDNNIEKAVGFKVTYDPSLVDNNFRLFCDDDEDFIKIDSRYDSLRLMLNSLVKTCNEIYADNLLVG